MPRLQARSGFGIQHLDLKPKKYQTSRFYGRRLGKM
jgi:hypothetical protein